MKNNAFMARIVFALAISGYTVSTTSYADTEDQCVDGEQYNFVAKDVEGEEHLMWATCILDTETSSYQWYYSRENPKGSAN